MGAFDCHRRSTVSVRVGDVTIGDGAPVRVQSMTNTSTMDTSGSVAQVSRIAAAGADIVRLTAQGVREAKNLGEIHSELRRQGCNVPLVADIHFNPRAAFEAAVHVEKVRINPGNFVDPGRTFRKLSYTEEEYAAELARIDAALVPFLELCREHGTAVRIGVNHGSLSDRIMSRYGDTPAGITESAMEFLRVCRRVSFNDVVISVKASNVRVMVETVRMLVSAMDKEDMHYPLHLGVTEAGDGEDGRIKSAVGIGTLMSEGIGDTIRVSLSEAPENEVPVGRALVKIVQEMASDPVDGSYAAGYDPISPQRRKSVAVGTVGGYQQLVVVSVDSQARYDCDSVPDLWSSDERFVSVNAPASDEVLLNLPKDKIIKISSSRANFVGAVSSTVHRMMDQDILNPVVVDIRLDDMSADEAVLRASVGLGALLMNGLADGVMISGNALSPQMASRTAFGILQATRLRITRTEYIACPGCGRTMFDLQSTLRRVREATSHLRGLKIGVMGCIVNGPGEMADADYGYVGAGQRRISLYKGKECIEKNIPEEDAVEHLLRAIENNRR